MKATIKTEVGEVVIEGTVDEFRALLFPKSGLTHNSLKKEIQEALIGPSLRPPFEEYREHFRSEGKVKASDQKPRTYIYYRRDRDDSYIVYIKDCRGVLEARLELGSLDDPESRIGKVVTALRMLQRDTFTSRELFANVQNGWWRNRSSRIKAAIDILQKERLIKRESEPPTVPIIYRRMGALVDRSEALKSHT